MKLAIGKSKIFAALVLFAMAIQLDARPQIGPTKPELHPEHDLGHRLKAKGIPNFGEVTPTLYRGGQPSPEGVAALAKMGINVVVDLRAGRQESEEQEARKLGMQYISIPAHCPFPRDEPYARFLTVVRENPEKKVFVHCRLGDDRTGMAVAAYRMAEEHWTADEAVNEMQKFGFTASHHLICPNLSSYVHSFPERLKNNPAFDALRANDGAAKTK
jgi:protein tyrosine phosphatase (PTP) superfamily phosphohydrolase (DUF442 family)